MGSVAQEEKVEKEAELKHGEWNLKNSLCWKQAIWKMEEQGTMNGIPTS